MSASSQAKTRRVRIVGDHPHRGESGTLTVDAGLMRAGMLPVKLDACAHGTDACYVAPEHIRDLPADEDETERGPFV